ncbi:MAG: hydroxymethylbilane synthase [Magnetovibrio sp.]|nr:hydroxymethylbilane synthase [Magnetovibrio sp.]
MATEPLLKIGTRASPLALAQTHEAGDRLAAAAAELSGEGAVGVVEIKTTGDKVQDRPLAELGGKGLFAKELDSALLDGRIDIAVHSLKDLETALPDGIVLGACLEREDPRDVLISPAAADIDALPEGARVGTASLRRRAQLLHRRPDLRMTLLRGNIQTRMRKIADGEADATFLALAGLNRMGLADRAACVLDPDEMLPACGQGAIGITCRTDDARALAWLAAVNHAETMIRVSAERAMLAALDGSCRTPIGGLADIDADGGLRLRGLVARADGSEIHRGERQGGIADAAALGAELGAELRARAGDDLFE